MRREGSGLPGISLALAPFELAACITTQLQANRHHTKARSYKLEEDRSRIKLLIYSDDKDNIYRRTGVDVSLIPQPQSYVQFGAHWL